jgi:hypothetical protein
MIKKGDIKFNSDLVVGQYRHSEFLEIKNLIDIIPCIERDNANDMEILGSWKDHFQSLGVPYAVTAHTAYRNKAKDVPYYTLWKRRMI